MDDPSPRRSVHWSLQVVGDVRLRVSKPDVPTLLQWERAFWVVQSAATVILVLRLWTTGLRQSYPFFGLYLTWNILSSAALFWIPRRTNLYTHVYIPVEIVFWGLFVLTTVELFSGVLRRFQGVARWGRRMINLAFVLAITFSIVSVWIWPPVDQNAPMLTRFVLGFFVVDRFVCLSSLAFLVLMSLLTVMFPIPFPANATRLLLGYALCFAGRTMALFTINIYGFSLAEWSSLLRMAVVTLCTLYWVWKVLPSGENAELVVGPRWTAEREQKLVEHISAINQTLSGNDRPKRRTFVA